LKRALLTSRQRIRYLKQPKKVYIKEISTFAVKPLQQQNLIDNNDVIVATAKYGKGAVFVVGDPWFYNEYTDGRKAACRL